MRQPTLDAARVLADLNYPESLENLQAIQRGKSLVSRITSKKGTFFAPPTDGSDFHEWLHVHDRPGGKFCVHCSCSLGRKRANADADRLCEHAGAVLMALGFSQTFNDWQSLCALIPQTPPPLGEPISRESFYAPPMKIFYAAINDAKRRWAGHGLDMEMIKAAYYQRFGVPSVADFDEKQMTVAAEEMSAAARDDAIMGDHAKRIKDAL